VRPFSRKTSKVICESYTKPGRASQGKSAGGNRLSRLRLSQALDDFMRFCHILYVFEQHAVKEKFDMPGRSSYHYLKAGNDPAGIDRASSAEKRDPRHPDHR